MPKGEKWVKFSEEFRARVVRRYLTPLPDGTWEGANTIGRAFGINPQTVYWFLRRAGVPTRDAVTSQNPGAKRPYRNIVPRPPNPGCACGCIQPCPWLPTKSRWRQYVPGHEQNHPAYDPLWLRREYSVLRKSQSTIARESGISVSQIGRLLTRFGIPRRPLSEIHVGLQAGPNNPAWKGGVAKWAYSSDWKRIAAAVRREANYTCERCALQLPKSSHRLHVHHIDEDKFNNDRANLALLCWRCHGRAHSREGVVLR